MDEPDEFTRMMEAAGFDVTNVAEVTDEEYTYSRATLHYHTDDDLPVNVIVEFPDEHAMDAARALVASGSWASIRAFLATAYQAGDGTVNGWFDANGIDGEQYNAQVEAEIAEDGPATLADADEFFNLDK